MTTMRSLLATGALAAMLAALPAQAALFTPGTAETPSPPGHGFPLWYTDTTGTSLAPCLSTASIGTGPLCVLLADPGFDPNTTISFPDNFPAENFYFIADSLIDLGAGNSARYRAALEGAFTNGTIQLGQQISFVRIRFTVDAPVDGNYRITHPFGQRVITNVTAGNRAIRVQEDWGLGAPGGPFAAIDAPAGYPQLFLASATGPITAGNEVFIGDPNVDQKIVGATFQEGNQPFNAFRVEIDTDKDGVYDQTFINDNFQVAGKLLGLTVTPAAGTDFGTFKLQTASPAKTFTVKNISAGILTLDINSFASSNTEFAITGTNCAQLAAGATCTFDAVFTPTINGARTATFTISGGATVPPALLNVTGTGDSIPPTVGISAPATGSFTNNPTPVLTYTVSDGTVVVFVDDIVVQKVSGNSLASLGDGSHTIRVEATDVAGNVGSAVSTFTVDTVPPTATVTGAPQSPTNATGATLTVGGAQVVSYQVKIDNGPLGADVPVGTATTLASLSEGTHTVAIFGKDQAGNVQPTATTVSWTVDTTPPVLTLDPVGNPTNLGSKTIGGTVENGIVPVVTPAGPATAGTVTQNSGTWSCTISGLVEGANAFSVTATDAAGNAITRSGSVTLDTIPPTYEIAGKPADPTNVTSATLSVSGTGVATYRYKLDNGTFIDRNGGETFTLSGLSDGAHTVTVTAKDLAGNEGAPVTATWTVDTVKPALTLTPVVPSTSLLTLTIGGTVEAGVTPVVTTDTGATVAPVAVNGTTWSAVLSNLTVGLNRITVTATDAAGNGATDSDTVAAGSFAVTASAGTGGTISPDGLSSVLFKGTKTFTITPAVGYHVADVVVNGVSRGARKTLTLTNIQADQTVAVTFAHDTYTISATAGVGGTISPKPALVEHGGSQTFTITPNAGYHILSVMVDGVSVGRAGSYTFDNVTAKGHRITAKFSNTWTIFVRKTGRGTVTGGVAAKVREGTDKIFSIKPARGWQLSDVTLDGVSVKDSVLNNRLTVSNVTEDHDLNVTFVPAN